MKFSYFDAAIWTAGVTSGWLLLVSMVASGRPSAASDLVVVGGIQVLASVAACALFAWRRPGRSYSELFALRATAFWLYPISILLGFALQGPAQTLSELFERIAPTPEKLVQKQLEMLWPTSTAHAWMILAVAALAGPFVEELIYRGAIYTALRPARSAAAAGWAAALCFTLSHLDPRAIHILALALVLGFLRVAGGSIWPSFLTHAVFNGTTLIIVFLTRDKPFSLPPWLLLGGWAASALLLLAGYFLARHSPRAGEARKVDEIPVQDSDQEP